MSAFGSIKLRAFVALTLSGWFGVASLVLIRDRLLGAVPPHVVDAAGGPVVLMALSLIQPMLLVAIAAATGLAVNPALGLRSLVAERAAGRTPRPISASLFVWSIAGGMGAAALIFLGEAAFSPWTGEALALASAAQRPSLAATAAGIFYGGVAEEIMVRWGLLGLIAWVLTRLGMSRPAALGAAILAAALLFGFGHLPAMAQLVDLTPAVVVRTVALNAMPGLIFGLLYVRLNLEAAMLAHGSTHVFLYALALTGVT